MADPANATSALRGLLPQVLGRAKVVISPYPFGLSEDDNLRVTSVNAVTGVTLEVHYRLITREGEVKAGVFKHTPNSNRTAKTEDFAMAGGFVTNLSVFATGGSPLIGQTFVIVQLIRGMGGVAVVLGTMLQGYVTTTQGLGWPGSPITSSTDGEPVVRAIRGTTPASGGPITETVPTNARWQLMSFRTVAIRTGGGINVLQPQLDIATPAGNIGSFLAFSKFPFDTTSPVVWASGLTAPTTTNGAITGPLPDGLILPAGSSITVAGAGAICDWDAPNYVVREWQEAP